MRPLPYSDLAAGIAFYVLWGTFALLELRARIRSGLNRQGSRSRRGGLAPVYAAVVMGVFAAFALAPWHAAAIRSARWPLFVVGLVLMAMGIGVRQWAVTLLGQFFTVDVRVHPGQVVVDRGPYRWVRHPSYTGLLLTLAGAGLALGNWAALAATVVLPTAGLVLRIRAEERALLDALGEPYRRFAATRARLIPRVW